MQLLMRWGSPWLTAMFDPLFLVTVYMDSRSLNFQSFINLVKEILLDVLYCNFSLLPLSAFWLKDQVQYTIFLWIDRGLLLLSSLGCFWEIHPYISCNVYCFNIAVVKNHLLIFVLLKWKHNHILWFYEGNGGSLFICHFLHVQLVFTIRSSELKLLPIPLQFFLVFRRS